MSWPPNNTFQMTLPARWAPPHIPRQVSKFARSAATTFAPRASGATGKNPAYKGSALYTIFEVQVRPGRLPLTSALAQPQAGGRWHGCTG